MHPKIWKLFSLAVISLLLFGCAANRYGNGNFAQREDVQCFIQKVSTRDNFEPKKLNDIFNQVNPDNMIVKSEKKPHEKTMTWENYRTRLITPQHIERGAAFWSAHQNTLDIAWQRYGVEPETIIGILGVETDYGKYLGKFRAIDALSTLAFNFPKRQHFFQNELEEYLLLTRELDKDPVSLPSSYAGALGLPQFMPSSYRHLAVSENHHAPDLFNNADDAIMSIANYFQHKGWQPYQPVALQTGQCYRSLQLGNQCWQVYPNFLVIKRYNDSNFYAMAVYQLGQAVKARKYR